ncbi:unnamed protein product [Ilex paraguariensis]|uniref:non-specific serine/threonine protein kinase n=1 Tax=Ilex paraguariensis TaxID=185542 RepID=A0ABC8RAM0_9AQUA
MAAIVLFLFLVVQLPRGFASGFLIHSKARGNYRISYSSDSSHEWFYINGKLVDKDLFCQALKLLHVNHCLYTGNVIYKRCGSDHSLDELGLEAGRRFLREVVREEYTGHGFGQRIQASKEKDGHTSLLTPKRLAMAVPGIFGLCCCLLCPCFRTRRKETTNAVLARDPISMDSVSSLEINSVPEKIPASPLRVPPSPSRFSMSPQLNRVGSVHLNMNQVTRATQNFSPSLKLGEGGFGTVYKAQLQDGQVVAIKRAKKEHFEALRTEFRSEIELLAKIEHRNLVKLLGYIDKGNERLLITEYVPNGTLREHLDGLRGKILDFKQRLEICIDVAHGLTYLHLYAGDDTLY